MDKDNKEMESTISKTDIKTAPATVDVGGSGASAPIKIKWPLKLFLFCLSSFTLSLVFEGLRQVKEAFTVGGAAVLLIGAVTTLFLVALQGFFMYCEERSKGNRTRKIALFDKWYLQLVSKQKGDSTNRG